MNNLQLRDGRVAAGLTQAQVARAAGTSVSNLSAYEHGSKRPGKKTLQRLQASLNAGSDSPIHDRSLLGLPALAAATRRGLATQWSVADLVRLARESRAGARNLGTDADWTLYLAEPSTTGDPRWDALVAGLAELVADEAGRPRPAWSTDRPALPTFWWVGEPRATRAYVFAHTPFALMVRGVMLDPTDLVAV